MRAELASEILNGYRAKSWHLFAVTDREKLVAIAGLRLEKNHEPELLHLAVKEDMRLMGVGKKTIKSLINKFKLSRLTVWTDDDAVGFYQKLGFKIEQEESTLHGLKRYKLLAEL